MLKLNIGIAKKVGEANYGSRGASVNLEMELASDLVAKPAQLQERIRNLFGLAKQSVEEELSGKGQEANGHDNIGHTTNGNASNGHQANVRKATQSQVRAIHAIASRHGRDLSSLLWDRFGRQKPESLSITEASQLIDELKSQNGAETRQ